MSGLFKICIDDQQYKFQLSIYPYLSFLSSLYRFYIIYVPWYSIFLFRSGSVFLNEKIDVWKYMSTIISIRCYLHAVFYCFRFPREFSPSFYSSEPTHDFPLRNIIKYTCPDSQASWKVRVKGVSPLFWTYYLYVLTFVYLYEYVKWCFGRIFWNKNIDNNQFF